MEDFVSAPWLRRLIAAVVLAGLVVLGFRVLEPFIVPLVWACILAFVSWPAHARLLRLCRGRSTVASLLTTTAVSLAVIAPLAWLAVVLRIELIRAYHETQALLAGGLQLPPAVLKLPWLGEQLRDRAGVPGGPHHRLRADPLRRTDTLGRRRRVARDQRQPRGGRGAAHLGRNRGRLDRPHRAAFPHQPRGADSLSGGDVRRAGRARGVRTRGPLRGSGDSRGAARDLARVAAAERPAGRAGLSAVRAACGRRAAAAAEARAARVAPQAPRNMR